MDRPGRKADKSMAKTNRDQKNMTKDTFLYTSFKEDLKLRETVS